MYVQLTDLPESITNALKASGYHCKDINVEPRDSISMMDCGGAGRRGFVVLVDIATGRSETHLGSFGGANMFNQNNAVDLDRTERTIIPGMAVIKGSQGEKTFATLYLNPENVVKMLPAKPEVSERDKQILEYMGYKSGYRKEYLERMKATTEEIDSLVNRGMLKKLGRGLSLTTEGKNAAR